MTLHISSSFNSFTTDATPEFEQPEYSVPEDEGPAEVCVVVPAGQIERDVIVQLVEELTGTATSKPTTRYVDFNNMEL